MQCLIVLALLLVQHAAATALEECTVEDCRFPYVIVLDAGSTGTRVNVYRFERNRKRERSVSRPLSEVVGVKVSPGLDSFVNALERIPQYLKPLIDFAKSAVPTESHAYTMILMGSTAGVRGLRVADRRKIVYKTNAVLSSTPFLTVHTDKPIPMDTHHWKISIVLSGRHEAAFALYSVNLLRGVFEYDSKPYGLLELGGGSVQRAFIYRAADLDPFFPEHVSFSQSHMGAGMSAATLSILDYRPETLTSVHYSPCLSPHFAGTFSFGGVTIRVAGDPRTSSSERWSECLRRAETLVETFTYEQPSREFNSPYAAIGAFYNVAKTLHTLGYLKRPIPGHATVNEFIRAGAMSCENPPTKGKYEPYLCLNSAYISDLLRTGYRLDDAHPLFFTEKINGVTVGWPLGLAANLSAYWFLIEWIFKESSLGTDGMIAK